MTNSESSAHIQSVEARGQHTLREILTQPAAWQAALDVVETHHSALQQLWNAGQFSDVIVTGCGSTHYLSQAVAPLIQQQLGTRARYAPASDLVLFPATILPPDGSSLLLTISRSGRTTETIRAASNYCAQKLGKVLNIGCYDEMELVKLSDLALTIAEGQEQSVVQTRSFSAMLTAAQAAIAALTNNGQFQAMRILPAVGERLIAAHHHLARELGGAGRFDRFYFLGSGLQYGLASEVNLKMKEMSLSVSEAFHFMEFRHGPMSMVNERTLVVGLVSEAARDYELAVLREMRALGGQTLVLADQPIPDEAADYQISFQTGLPEASRGVLYLPILQLLSYYRAISKGLDPDQPHNLTAVIVLEPGQ